MGPRHRARRPGARRRLPGEKSRLARRLVRHHQDRPARHVPSLRRSTPPDARQLCRRDSLGATTRRRRTPPGPGRRTRHADRHHAVTRRGRPRPQPQETCRQPHDTTRSLPPRRQQPRSTHSASRPTRPSPPTAPTGRKPPREPGTWPSWPTPNSAGATPAPRCPPCGPPNPTRCPTRFPPSPRQAKPPAHSTEINAIRQAFRATLEQRAGHVGEPLRQATGPRSSTMNSPLLRPPLQQIRPAARILDLYREREPEPGA